MVPGVSRSGATIVSAMLLGAERRAAAEFSFWLAMPTMAGAFAYDLLKSYKLLGLQDVGSIAIGFLAAFLSGLLVVRAFLNYIAAVLPAHLESNFINPDYRGAQPGDCLRLPRHDGDGHGRELEAGARRHVHQPELADILIPINDGPRTPGRNCAVLPMVPGFGSVRTG